ncbi:MAG TPA: hypothetical protein VF135_06950 [Terriglobales bacterium]
MRKLSLLTLILLVSVGWAVAQSPAPGNSPAGSPQSPSTQAPGSPSAQPGMPDASQQQPGTPSSPADQGQQDAQSASAMGAGNSVEGCLGGAAGKFNIIDKAGTTYQLQLPASADTSMLNKHIGEEVRVTGTMSNAKSSASAGDASAASAGGAGASGGSQPSIAVTKIDKVADKCSTNTSSPNQQ